MLSLDTIRRLPKVTLHDHLDGGLRSQTVIDHCEQNGHTLPSTDAEELGRWFFEAADSGSLVRYLETFEHTVAALQTAEQLNRAAREFALDQAADGVVYAEARWAPEQHLRQGLSIDEAIEAVREGLSQGMDAAAEAGTPIVAQQILASMRHDQPSTAVAEAAVRHRERGVCGFDIAGAELGYSPTRFLPAFELLRRENCNITIHAGEAEGVTSVWEALQICGAHRLGHGVRVIEDVDLTGPTPVMGDVAHAVRDHRVTLEVAPTSNLQTGNAERMADHPIDALYRLGFRVTVNCDNRLMSGTTMSREYHELAKAFGWGLEHLERTTVAAMEAAFLHHDERQAMIAGIIRPAYAAARAEVGE